MRRRSLKQSKKSKKSLISLICLVLLCTLSVGSVFAYLSSRSNKLENTFEPGIVSCEVEESFDGTTKSNVFVTNTGNVSAYIRASILINWINEKGEIYGASAPVKGRDYQIEFGEEWREGGDGYFYYDSIVYSLKDTPVLIEECTEISGRAPKGYSLYVEVISSAVQADPNKTKEAWGVEVN